MSATRTVLIPVDNHEHSERALKWYIENIGKSDNDRVLLLTIVEPKYKSVKSERPPSDVAKEICENMSKFQADVTERAKCYIDILQKHGFTNCSHEFKAGSKPGEVICEFLPEKNVNLVVIGNRQMGALKRTLVGSVSDHILHHGHVPVIIVPPPTHHHE